MNRRSNVGGFVDRWLDPVVTAAVLGSMTDRFPGTVAFQGAPSNATSTRKDRGRLTMVFMNALQIESSEAPEQVR